mmetsp:Transcript_41461/g.70995  ORF Transcript_41461/g.70995 Transcript_41461/m.70995 type:complete len:499 (+) Transcript_41461:65-1561(+)|eukprot:CAMPEP_0183704132 /NCGR_PEP_ID=MMETSP0737-20130205/1574_1 /TAXON_ID=385413 /ORGANISM="Thalassiosira miniscula, Strain CCMP1093" /LENGTH=498 /DNA_ID=CAMNT_0025930953 /DNA_START=23 /DNA_END=1519 /DNA_ORIENTATION=+
METEKEVKTEVEVAPNNLADPGITPAMESDGVNAEGDASLSVPVPTKADEEVPVPYPPPLEPVPGSSPRPALQSPNETMAMSRAIGDEITITDQDVLFGRGGLTNRHIGNLRYRDIISIHREDYVRAQKTEKPNVARRIVKAIRTGKNPGRFLRKGENGKWVEVNDREATWKASQALREKSRWSCMRQDSKQAASPSGAQVTADSMMPKQLTEIGHAKAAEDPKKRAAPEAREVPKVKKAKAQVFSELPMHLHQAISIEAVPTEISHIAVPQIMSSGNTKHHVGANYMLPATMNTNANDIFPKDEDVLFGRGGRTNHHPGNKRLRQIVNKYREIYNQAKKVDKPKVSKLIVSALRNANPPSRFLRMNEETTQWEDVGDKRAAEKVSQTLREKEKTEKIESAQKRLAEAIQAVAAESEPVSETRAPAAAAPQLVPQAAPQAEPPKGGVVKIPLAEHSPVQLPSPEKVEAAPQAAEEAKMLLAADSTDPLTSPANAEVHI